MMNTKLNARIDDELALRASQGMERSLRVFFDEETQLNLANNDYLELAKNPEVIRAGQKALERWGGSASASPLVTGYGEAHEALLNKLFGWYRIPFGMLWNTGYAANHAVLSQLPSRGDLVLADRLIHNSMIQGILASGARLIRYDHCDMKHLSDLLNQHAQRFEQVFVVTESVFSMDGDYPDLRGIAELKDKHDFFWVLDEAHAIGWFGDRGCGVAEAAGVMGEVDALIGTLGKGLGSMGAFALFRQERYVRYLIQTAGEFIYSTYLSPVCAAMADKAIDLVSRMQKQRKVAHRQSMQFRKSLLELGLNVPVGDSPVVPVLLNEPAATLSVARQLEEWGVRVGAIRPPTVPVGGSRLRLSLKLNFNEERQKRILDALKGVLVS